MTLSTSRASAPGSRLQSPDYGGSQHGVVRSAVLHLAPGVVMLCAYLFVGVPIATAARWPYKAAFVLADVAVLIPLLLGAMLWEGRRMHGFWTLVGVVVYRRRLSPGAFAAAMGVVLVGALAGLGLVGWTEPWLQREMFWWAPRALTALDVTDPSTAARGVLIATRLAAIAVVGIAAPLVEECYFRGFLLPRVAWMGGWAAPWQAVLFAAYHLWSPWALPWRVAVLVPAIYVVQRTRSFWFMAWGHVVGNTVGELIALAALWR